MRNEFSSCHCELKSLRIPLWVLFDQLDMGLKSLLRLLRWRVSTVRRLACAATMPAPIAGLSAAVRADLQGVVDRIAAEAQRVRQNRAQARPQTATA